MARTKTILLHPNAMCLSRYAVLVVSVMLSITAAAENRQQEPASTKRHPTTQATTTLYLTFDDGPVDSSRALNQIAYTDSVRLNLFISARFVFRNDTMKQIMDDYRKNPFIETGNHGFTHAGNHYRRFYSDSLNAIADFMINQDTLHLAHKIARLPGRNIWRVNGKARNDLQSGKMVADSLAALGYVILGWDMEWHIDSAGKVTKTANELLGKVQETIRRHETFMPGHIVILCHDAMLNDPYNKRELIAFIRMVKEIPRFRFGRISKYSFYDDEYHE